jgi:L,D-transpeptidase catalytic domain
LSLTTNRRGFHRLACGSFAALGLGASGAAAQLVTKHAEQLQNGEFNWHPERAQGGPLLIIVSIPDQKVHVYRNGIRVAASTCSTGKPGHSTPTGVFKILQKDKHHRSSTYNNAPMPNMNRLTWSGVALHAGQLPGYPASHGCVRLPMAFSELLFGITKMGMTVVIADSDSFPRDVVHPGMVLGQYARAEFGAVDAALHKSQYSAGHDDSPRSTSIVVSGADRTMTIWENGGIVASGRVAIKGDRQPLSERAYLLNGHDGEKGDLRWSGVGYGKQERGDMTAELRRIEAEKSVREEARRRMHHGTTLVTTNGSSTEVHRSASDFVVIGGLY